MAGSYFTTKERLTHTRHFATSGCCVNFLIYLTVPQLSSISVISLSGIPLRYHLHVETEKQSTIDQFRRRMQVISVVTDVVEGLCRFFGLEDDESNT